VTGASEGIGRVLAIKLAQSGYKITGVARSEEKLRALVNELGDGNSYLVADLATDAGQEKIAAELRSRHYDLLVNNAGIGENFHAIHHTDHNWPKPLKLPSAFQRQIQLDRG
ncbi:MAG: SDR family NAD(P)-dependent oxidoreductase, partial [Pseudomonadota bacterium]